FANAIGREAKLSWDTEPNPDAAGGRIVILLGSYATQQEIHAKLVAEARAAGKELIDFFFFVPSSDVFRGGDGPKSGLGRALASQGYNIWDATDRDIRRDFARGIDTLRIVQYASCRGLEGWTVIAESLDRHWQECFQQRLKSGLEGDTDLFRSPED